MIALADVSGELNGAKIVTQWFLKETENHGIPTFVFNTLPKRKSVYRIKRVLLSLKAISFLIGKKLRGERNLYLPLAGGSYLIFQFLYVVIAEALGYQIYIHHHSYSYINKKSVISRKMFSRTSPKITQIFLTQKMKSDFGNMYGNITASRVLTNALVVKKLNWPSEMIIRNDSERKLKLVHYGRLSSVKGSDLVLELYSKLLRMNINVSCLVAGPVQEKEINLKIFELKTDFPQSFSHIEYYSHVELPQILLDCDFFLFPSKYENEAAPLVLYEAQLNGLVCYTSKAGSMESIVVTPGITTPIENWLDFTFNEIGKRARSISEESSAGALFNKKQIISAMEDEALGGHVSLQKLLSHLTRSEPFLIT